MLYAFTFFPDSLCSFGSRSTSDEGHGNENGPRITTPPSLLMLSFVLSAPFSAPVVPFTPVIMSFTPVIASAPVMSSVSPKASSQGYKHDA